jgi:hypothetical protein
MIFWMFWTLVVSASAYAICFGGREERLVTVILVAAYFATFLLSRLSTLDWLQPQLGILATDSLASILLLFIALRSKRFWPLPIVAFQILPVATQLVATFGENLVSYGLGVAQGAWSYLQLIVLVIATTNTRRRMQN